MTPVAQSDRRGHCRSVNFHTVNIAAGRLETPSTNTGFSGGIFGGFSVYNADSTATHTVVMEIWDSATAASGSMLAVASLTVGGTAGCTFTAEYHVEYEQGLWVVLTGTGTAKGTIRFS